MLNSLYTCIELMVVNMLPSDLRHQPHLYPSTGVEPERVVAQERPHVAHLPLYGTNLK